MTNTAPSQSITAAIVGASGYSGAELVRLLLGHSRIALGPLFASSSAGRRVDELYPALRGRTAAAYQVYSADAASEADIIFIALPSGKAMHIVPELLRRGRRVIDLGGDFRLQDPVLYAKYYKHTHTATDILPKAVYAFPEWDASRLPSATLVSNPGCYPTSAILPLAPLLKGKLVEPAGIVVNSLSGVSGAGRASSTELSFGEVNESVRPYKVGTHQHIPEIQYSLSNLSGESVTVTFVPHLLPITRGILSSIYARPSAPLTDEVVAQAYSRYYGNAPFVRVLGPSAPEIKNVTHTNFIDIGWKLYPDNGHIIILSVIDNLVKGAAGQAVQSMNLMFGFSETEGLL